MSEDGGRLTKVGRPVRVVTTFSGDARFADLTQFEFDLTASTRTPVTIEVRPLDPTFAPTQSIQLPVARFAPGATIFGSADGGQLDGGQLDGGQLDGGQTGAIEPLGGLWTRTSFLGHVERCATEDPCVITFEVEVTESSDDGEVDVGLRVTSSIRRFGEDHRFFFSCTPNDHEFASDATIEMRFE